VLALAVGLALALPPLVAAHVERSSYWPDPAADGSVKPAAGGEVPKARSLGSALRDSAPGETRVVCQPGSLARAKRLIANAESKGYRLRPSADRVKISAKRADSLMRINRELEGQCEYSEIQPAIFDSGNNDRVVVMPGIYKEPTARSQPTNDPACADLRQDSDHGTGAVSYRYQAECPNDQNLIAIIGREPSTEPEPSVNPETNRRGIPNAGKCIRCNLQLEGSGPSPSSVIVEAGRAKSGNGGPARARKDVGIRGDRTDGIVIRNLLVRHAAEHGIYLIEVDGYRLDRVRLFWNEEYGILTFTSDHGLTQNCEAAGSGDAGYYPGAAAQTGEQTVEPTQRYNQEVRRCDLHHNVLGNSASMGDAVHFHHNEVYDNAVGISVDSISAAGHPGYPQDSFLIEHNNIYSNNFNPFEEGSDVHPTVPAAVGTGMWIAGGNNNELRSNHIYDNWRRGVMLFTVPDAVACAPTEAEQTCDEAGISNSFRNRFHDNQMSVTPAGEVLRNGVDFWWDEFPTTTNNCWFANSGADGSAGSVTGDPSSLPSDCSSSVGTGNPPKEGELTSCFAAFTADALPEGCPWFTTPPKP
jgi:hypothetical protein